MRRTACPSGGLRAEIAEHRARRDEEPEEDLVDRPISGRAHRASVSSQGRKAKQRDRAEHAR